MREPRTDEVFLNTPAFGHSELTAHVMKLIEQHYADHLTLTKIARMTGRSPLLVRHEFRRAAGMSLREYLTVVRMERAQALLKAGEKVEAVALQVGYRSKRQFIRQFKDHAGMLPSHFRQVDHGSPVGASWPATGMRNANEPPAIFTPPRTSMRGVAIQHRPSICHPSFCHTDVQGKPTNR
jgi:AraC-like DNA-binding protein